MNRLPSACEQCGFIHTSTDAQTIGRFSGTPRYQARSAGTPPRLTRAEAEADECQWRQRRPRPTPPTPPRPTEHPALLTVAQVITTPAAPVPFPAAQMEDAARAKAWRDFLANVRFSLGVWQLDGDVRANCAHVLDWLRCCRDDLSEFLDTAALTTNRAEESAESRSA